MATERRQIRIRTAPADEGRTGDIQAVVLDRVEHPQPGIGAVARDKDDLDLGALDRCIQPEQLLHQHEGIAGPQDFILVGDLILAVRLDPFALVYLMAFPQIEQRPRGNRHHQLVAQPLAHPQSSPDRFNAPDCARR
ncbi:hypothetical protein D3C81_1062960 [compost metagenome]